MLIRLNNCHLIHIIIVILAQGMYCDMQKQSTLPRTNCYYVNGEGLCNMKDILETTQGEK